MINKKQITTYLRLLFSIILVAVFLYIADLEKILGYLKNLGGFSIILIFTLILLSIIVSGLKWQVLLPENRPRIIKTTRIFTIGLFFNNFLPSSIGGDGMRIYLINKEGIRKSTSASSVVLDRLFASLTLAGLGFFSSLFATHFNILAFSMFTILFILVTIMITLILKGWIPGFINKKTSKLKEKLKAFIESAKNLRHQPSIIVKNLILGAVFQILVALVIGAVFLGLNFQIPNFIDLIYISTATSVLAMIPLGLNGYGLREGAYIYLLQAYGYNISQSISISVIFAIMVSIFSFLGGLDYALSHFKSFFIKET
ncbi:MAG: lysylphosphatidylglycerol synthase transmembrane domain-containing protein [Firmicutes bacterium]|nr:lysylphosphatidylglycerol synthase transmembrane domain-containing protein [Bacillota bacterium]